MFSDLQNSAKQDNNSDLFEVLLKEESEKDDGLSSIRNSFRAYPERYSGKDHSQNDKRK